MKEKENIFDSYQISIMRKIDNSERDIAINKNNRTKLGRSYFRESSLKFIDSNMIRKWIDNPDRKSKINLEDSYNARIGNIDGKIVVIKKASIQIVPFEYEGYSYYLFVSDKKLSQYENLSIPNLLRWVLFTYTGKNKMGVAPYDYCADNTLSYFDALGFGWLRMPNNQLQNLHSHETKPIVKLIVKNSNEGDNIMHPVNLILYGPPGTGKTYNTVNKALEVFGIKTNDKSREEIKKLFGDMMIEGQIVFTTFHQSMSYEDFIEGIKPLEPKDDDSFVKYSVLPGIFKQVCGRALKSYRTYKDNSLTINETIKPAETKPVDVGFENVYSILKEQINEGKFKFRDNFPCYVNKNDGISYDSPTGTGSLSKKEIHEIFAGNRPLSQAYPMRRKQHQDVNAALRIIKYNLINAPHKEIDRQKPAELDSYVLIIDEINRGNVAQIFGELITLIEEDKRLGKDEALEVTLPYSKEKFGVPPNLYIIGTMNTADRSIEALDTALRRRFCFEEITPRYDLDELNTEIAGVLLKDLLKKINDRIEKLIDKDHMIGHSYFMSVKDIDNLKSVFQHKVNPLLQEYFYGDFGKIGLVLGAGFFEKEGKQDNPDKTIFAAFDDYDDNELNERRIYKLLDVTQMNDAIFTEAIAKLMD